MLSPIYENRIDPKEFSDLLYLLVKKAGVANPTEISKALADEMEKKRESLRKTIDQYIRYSEDVTNPNVKKCTSIKTQRFILGYLKTKMTDADGRLLKEYREWEKDIEKYFDFSSDAEPYYERARACFMKMNNAEKTYILKYYFDYADNVGIDLYNKQLLLQISEMPSKELLQEWNSFKDKLDITLLSSEKITPRQRVIYDFVCECMNMSLIPYSEYSDEETEGVDCELEFEKRLKIYYWDCAYDFHLMAPSFLKMTREKWFFMAQCLLNIMEEDPEEEPWEKDIKTIDIASFRLQN